MHVTTATLIKELRKLTGSGIVECKKALIEAGNNINLAIDNLRKSGQIIAAKKANRITAEGVIMIEVFNNEKSGAIIELNCESDFVSNEKNFLTFGKNILTTIVTNKNNNFDELKIKFENSRAILINKIGENVNIRRIAILNGLQIGSYLHGKRIGVLVAAENASKESLKHIAMHIAASKPEYITQKDIPLNIIDHENQIQSEIAIKSGKSYEISKKIIAGRINKFMNEISLTGQSFIINPNKTVGDFIKEKNIKITEFIRFEVGEGISKIKTDFVSEVAKLSKQ
ncbi:Elongation factor Ts [Candidatus Providencia siddallii]|uniref:Elongation factor Ts n=1 Tax=Candidatus Providencia siddallii TaxID=1715285 RepID=A0A0M6W7N3_9GAMM|nr:Elongation factor Ts [Candidatus Providencia siddallii]